MEMMRDGEYFQRTRRLFCVGSGVTRGTRVVRYTDSLSLRTIGTLLEATSGQRIGLRGAR
jgi:hypothetical protein